MKLFIFVLTILFSNFSHSGFISGNDLLSDCEANKNDVVYFQKNASCLSYIQGVIDHHTSMVVKEGYLCLTKGITSNQLKKIFINYANKNPETLHYTANYIVALSINEAFICDK